MKYYRIEKYIFCKKNIYVVLVIKYMFSFFVICIIFIMKKISNINNYISTTISFMFFITFSIFFIYICFYKFTSNSNKLLQTILKIILSGSNIMTFDIETCYRFYNIQFDIIFLIISNNFICI